MYQYRLFDHVMVAVISEEITLKEVESFAADVNELTQSLDELFIVALPINLKSYPLNVNELLKSASALKSSTDKVRRLYGIQIHPILTFLANVVSQLLRNKNNLIEAKNLDDLYRLIAIDAELFPNLKASLVHLDDIKAYVSSFEAPVEVR